MHYHIIWGSNTAAEPAVLNFSNREEAIDKFIDIAKAVEGADTIPPPMEEIWLDEKTSLYRMVSATHKYILIYCDNGCYNGKVKDPYQPVLN